MAAAPSLAASLVTFVFGDSLTEVGNNNYLQLSLAKSNYPFYGVDYIGGKPTGRFTNGRTIGDIISSKLGIPSPPPYLSLAPNDDALVQGVNYASGGAGILNDTGLYFIQRLTFDDQINNFKKTKESIEVKIGEEAANKLCNQAVYFIGLGSNDYVNNFLQPFLADGQQYTHDEFLGLLISTLGGQLTRLHQLGARKMIFHGLGPLGCIPSQRVKSSRGQCLKQVNLWVQQFNSNVQKLIATLNKHLPSAEISFADTYQAVFDLIDNPTAFGFKVSNTSCCNVDTQLGGLCIPNSKVCNNHSEYVFWDAFHPSDAANEVLAEKLFAKIFSPAPSAAPLAFP
ncbi:GDSL esterase/lipase [Forsythia ovata]|uniref:GDSL esterase/lipase n=1 Tax=Forsythia ovata TaxID=205694 RepID=A0ABD1UAJ9_9LAMI